MLRGHLLKRAKLLDDSYQSTHRIMNIAAITTTPF